MKIENISFQRVKRALKIPFVTALGKRETIDSIIIKMRLEDEDTIISEIPSSIAIKENEDKRKEILKNLKKPLRGLSVKMWEDISIDLRRRYPSNPLTVSGVEIALFKAYLHGENVSEYQFFGSRLTKIETDITVPLYQETKLVGWLQNAIRKGFSKFKIKLRGNIKEDLHFLSSISEIIKEKERDFKLRLDFNQGAKRRDFELLLNFLEKKNFPIELLEQPLHRKAFSEMRELKKNSPFPIILDESIITKDDLTKALDMEALSGVNLKIAKSGIIESLEILDIARKNGLKIMIGCMMESFVGLSTSVYLALGDGRFDFCDLDSIHFLWSKKGFKDISSCGPFYTLFRT